MDFEGSRRRFLETVGLALAGVLSAAFASGQDQKEKTAKDEKKKKTEAKTESGTAAKRDAPTPGEGEQSGRDTPPSKADSPSKDEVTDEIRTCPQCGASMYRQGRVWTCDTCGYSYVE